MFELNDPNAVISLENLNHQRTVISLEAAAPSQTLSAMTTKLPHFVADIKAFLTRTLNPFAASVALVDSRKLEARFKTIDYVSASELGVYVPQGFKGTWLDYVQVLDQSQKVVDAMRDGLLKPFEVYLAELLTDPDKLRNNHVTQALARYKSPNLDKLRQDFAKFHSNQSHTESTYGSVVKRHADLPLVTRNLNEANTRFASIDRTVLIKQVDSISDLLGQLIVNIKENPEEYVVSGTTLSALSDLTFAMAREVEYYTTHGYFIDAFTVSVKDSYKRLEKAVER